MHLPAVAADRLEPRVQAHALRGRVEDLHAHVLGVAALRVVVVVARQRVIVGDAMRQRERVARRVERLVARAEQAELDGLHVDALRLAVLRDEQRHRMPAGRRPRRLQQSGAGRSLRRDRQRCAQHLAEANHAQAAERGERDVAAAARDHRPPPVLRSARARPAGRR